MTKLLSHLLYQLNHLLSANSVLQASEGRSEEDKERRRRKTQKHQGGSFIVKIPNKSRLLNHFSHSQVRVGKF